MSLSRPASIKSSRGTSGGGGRWTLGSSGHSRGGKSQGAQTTKSILHQFTESAAAFAGKAFEKASSEIDIMEETEAHVVRGRLALVEQASASDNSLIKAAGRLYETFSLQKYRWVRTRVAARCEGEAGWNLSGHLLHVCICRHVDTYSLHAKAVKLTLQDADLIICTECVKMLKALREPGKPLDKHGRHYTKPLCTFTIHQLFRKMRDVQTDASYGRIFLTHAKPWRDRAHLTECEVLKSAEPGTFKEASIATFVSKNPGKDLKICETCLGNYHERILDMQIQHLQVTDSSTEKAAELGVRLSESLLIFFDVSGYFDEGFGDARAADAEGAKDEDE